MGSQILGKSFVILETLAREFGGRSVTELAEAVNMNISTVHRILNSMKDRGYVDQDERKRYSISMKFVELSSSYLNSLDLKKEAEPHLMELSRKLNMTVFLATLMENQIVYIDRYEIFDGLRRYASIGERRPLYCTALGKALLLGFSDKELQEYAYTVDYRPYTAKTRDNGDDLIRDVRLAAVRGWSSDEEELQPNVSCRATPIFDYRGHIIAAVSTSGATEQLKGENGESVVEALMITAGRISDNLGYNKEAVQ